MFNYFISSVFAITLLWLDPDFNESPVKLEIERIDKTVFTDTLFHTVRAQHYTLEDFDCSLYFLDSNLRKINVFGIVPKSLYIRSYYFDSTDIFAVVEQRFQYKNYSFLNGNEVQKLNVEKAKQLDSLVSFETTNYYYHKDSLVGLTGHDMFLIDEPETMYYRANDFLIYYEKRLKKVAGR